MIHKITDQKMVEKETLIQTLGADLKKTMKDFKYSFLKNFLHFSIIRMLLICWCSSICLVHGVI